MYDSLLLYKIINIFEHIFIIFDKKSEARGYILFCILLKVIIKK